MNEYSEFSSKENYNKAIRHFKAVKKIVSATEAGWNACDFIEQYSESLNIHESQIPAIFKSVLIEKCNYACKSVNIRNESGPEISLLTKGWDKAEICAAYYPLSGGALFFNPCEEEKLNRLVPFEKNSLFVFYCKNKISIENSAKTLNVFTDIFLGKSREIPEDIFFSKTIAPLKESKKVIEKKESIALPAKVASKSKEGVRVAVLVTNELFHNGNLEAWKKIIASYNAIYPQHKVNVYYDQELIHDLNALFEWGKVKTGTNIYFSISGDGSPDVVKLKKYLSEGASPRFKKFLGGAPNAVLSLFNKI